MKRFPLWLLCGVLGCSSNPGLAPDPIPVTGNVTHAGTPLSGVKLNFLPAGRGAQERTVDVKDGAFNAEITPGEYLIIFTEGDDKEAAKKILEALPQAYLEPSEETKITVSPDTPLDLQIDG